MCKETAADRYADNLNKLERQIAELQELLAEKQKQQRPDWGHVGDLAHYNEVLSQVTDQFKRRGEFA